MTTDFSYNGKQIVSGGPFKPGGKDMPSDARTRVESYADIANIPNPHVGLKVTVKVDETNNNKMTDYIVKSLKANASGIANSVVDQVQRYADYLGASSGGSVSQEDINTAVNNYLTEHPAASGATVEQAAQIEANRTAIGDENSGLTKEVNDIKNVELQNLNTAIQTVNETIGNKSGLPIGDENIIASINRIDSKTLSENNILISPDNSKFKLKVDNSGNLSTEKINEYGQIILSTEALTINEGEPGSFEVKLNSAPTQDEVINLSVDNSNCTVSPTQLSFNSTNYSEKQTVTVNTTRDSSSYDDKSSVITLSNDNINSKTVNITIVNTDEDTNISVTGITLSKETSTLTVGDSETLTYNITPSNATNKEVNWSCNNDNCTVVDGLVTAIKEGLSVITVTTVDGNKTANCNITVSGESSKDIVKDGLVFRLDGKNTDSNAYLTDAVNGVVCNILNTGYTKTNNGVVIPKDSTACIEIPASDSNYGITNEMTLEVQTISPGKLSVFGRDANSSIAVDNVFKVYINYMNTSDVSSYKKNQNYDVENANKFMTGLHRISVTVSTDGNVLTYVDGELYAGFSDTIITDYKDLSTLFTSKNYSLKDTMYSGKSADESTFVSMTLYNRALSADEIKQNYDSDLFLENIEVLP